jgi:solute carrier family 35 protein E1
MERGRTPRLTLLLVLAYIGTHAAVARQHTAPRELRVAPPRRPLLNLRGGAKPYTRETAALLAWKLRTAKEPKAPPPRSVGLRNAGIAINLVLWWTLNVVFNLANKECLNSWPHPWALATLHLAVGSVCMLPLWLPLRRARDDEGRVVWKPVRQPPRLTGAEVRRLLPVAALLSTGHVTSTLAPAFGTVAFSNIVKTAEPLFTCFFSYVLYRRIFPAQVYISLLLVVAGVALVSTRDVNFSSFSLGAGMISNAAFALYAIRAKASMLSLPEITPRQTYALLTALSCLTLAPVASVMEYLGAGASRLASAGVAPRRQGWALVRLLGFTGLTQYLSNEIAFCTLSMIHPVTYAVSNTLKRSIVVAASLLFFGQRLPRSGALGAAMAISGALLYSLSMMASKGR